MSEVTLLHEQLSRDEYWTGEERSNSDGLRGLPLIVEGVSGTFLKHLTSSSVMRSHRHAVRSGYSPEPIPNGQILPLLSRNDGLIRTVEDARTITPIDGMLKQDMAFVGEEESFDEIAEEILANKLYQGEIAKLTILDHEAERAVKISRTATYLTGSITGQILVGLTSEHINGSRDFETTAFMFPDKVGQTYRRGRTGGTLTKIVQADILIPGSVSRARAKKQRKLQSSLSPSLG
jgi:hypothetical protein